MKINPWMSASGLLALCVAPWASAQQSLAAAPAQAPLQETGSPAQVGQPARAPA